MPLRHGERSVEDGRGAAVERTAGVLRIVPEAIAARAGDAVRETRVLEEDRVPRAVARGVAEAVDAEGRAAEGAIIRAGERERVAEKRVAARRGRRHVEPDARRLGRHLHRAGAQRVERARLHGAGVDLGPAREVVALAREVQRAIAGLQDGTAAGQRVRHGVRAARDVVSRLPVQRDGRRERRGRNRAARDKHDSLPACPHARRPRLLFQIRFCRHVLLLSQLVGISYKKPPSLSTTHLP